MTHIIFWNWFNWCWSTLWYMKFILFIINGCKHIYSVHWSSMDAILYIKKTNQISLHPFLPSLTVDYDLSPTAPFSRLYRTTTWCTPPVCPVAPCGSVSWYWPSSPSSPTYLSECTATPPIASQSPPTEG